MNGFLRWLAGTARRERMWTEAARALPQDFRLSEYTDILLGQEFQNIEKKNIRHYAVAACKPASILNTTTRFSFCDDDLESQPKALAETWVIYTCSVDLKTSKVRIERDSIQGDLFSALQRMAWYEDLYVNAKSYRPLEGDSSKATYTDRALKAGIYFDRYGVPYRPTAKSGLTESLTLRGDDFKAVFNAQSQEKAYDTWADINELIQPGVAPFMFKGLSSVTKSFAGFCEKNLRDIEELKQSLKDPSCSIADCIEKITDVQQLHRRYVIFGDCKYMEYPDLIVYADDLSNGARLKGLLDAGAEFYVHAASTGTLFDKRTQDLLKACSDAALSAVERYNLSREQDRAVKNLILLGPDPSSKPLPMAEYLNSFQVSRNGLANNGSAAQWARTP